MFKYLALLFLLFIFSVSKAQNPIRVSASNTTLVATDSILPFWFTANQQGKIKSSGSFLNISEFTLGQAYINKPESKFGFTWGTNLVAAFGNTNYYQINQAFAGISFKGWEITGGLFYNETKYAGLSTTNGNLARSQNARPFPAIRFSTQGFKSLPFAKKWLSFSGEFEEGLLNDKRYVDGAHLHHKNLYFKFQTSSTFNFKIGFEHFAMWGGTSQDKNFGQLPEGLDVYWRYILALPGNEEFSKIDQNNIAGNQFGTYQIEMVKDFSKINLTFYLSHPWEDNSGLNWHNWPDNLLGLHLHIKDEKKLVTDVVYEYTNTRQQSIKDSINFWDENSGQWKKNEFDNYFHNVTYKSGYTYKENVLCSPLFYPIIKSNGISMGIRSTRFFAHHLGAKGHFSDNISWKGMLTYIKHFGAWSIPYKSAQSQVSGLVELRYVNPVFPVEIGLATGTDFSNYNGKNLGFSFSITKNW